MKFNRGSGKGRTTESSNLNENMFKETFQSCLDVVFTSLNFHGNDVTFIYCAGLIDNVMLYNTVPARLDEYFQLPLEDRKDRSSITKLQLPSVKPIETLEQAEVEVFSGKLLILFKADNTVLSVDISKKPQRKPEETTLEISFKGPRDNFIEDIMTNLALIRKRLPTTSFVCENFEVGRRTKTKVFLLYINDVANKEVLKYIRRKIDSIDIDGLYSSTQLEELIDENFISIFPRYTSTGRPDYSVQALLNGRFVILIDGVSHALITPVNLFFLLKTAEDTETGFFYNSFERLIRLVAVAIAVLLPAFWVALTSFHQNQIPFTLLATIVEARKGVPLPTALEAILMLLLFEMFKEAGMRLPLSIGQTFSVIGGLIIGDAAIRAGLTSPAMLVIIAASTIATFTLVNQTLTGVVSLIRIFMIITASLFGFLGLFVSLYFLAIIIGRVHSFGVPYLQVASRLSIKNIFKSIFKVPEKTNKSRPSSLRPSDQTKKGGST
ncbi:spore germination protein [Calidifontibacillus erzurumensis]|uniref:Spore germination protein n=1 Tax=Calidifontibacillus erzurumensis TaxID=2741433 RepID=A0A8J8GEK9_9BACI|nr:spore germination protein [Calidifontibacillus erzurumensis]NSL52455.1 spore germination protein [Calidifontibacillus erzurumensis]